MGGREQISIPAGAIDSHLVVTQAALHDRISIPAGAIDSLLPHRDAVGGGPFQYQQVRLIPGGAVGR